jgi:DICT domain-containing protein
VTKLSASKPKERLSNSTAMEAGLRLIASNGVDVTVNAGHYYEMRLFSNEIEQHAFEDQMRAVSARKYVNTAFGGESLQ